RTMEAVISQEPQPLPELRGDLPPELVGIVEKALRKDPAGRYQRIADLASDLRRFRRATETGLHPARPARSVPAGVLIALAGVLAGGAGLGLFRRAPGAPGGPRPPRAPAAPPPPPPPPPGRL